MKKEKFSIEKTIYIIGLLMVLFYIYTMITCNMTLEAKLKTDIAANNAFVQAQYNVNEELQKHKQVEATKDAKAN